MTVPDGLTSFQVTVAQAFFELAQSDGFLLAGGAALLAQQLTTRPTQDLDFFASPGRGDIPAARDALESAAEARGWQITRIRDTATFCRLVVRGPENLVVDLALDAAPSRPPMLSFLGPTFDREELAGRKVVALFDRAEARDFTDVYALSATYPKDLLLALAAQQDPGFDTAVFRDMLASLSRFGDRDLPITLAEVPALRSFFATWSAELTSQLTTRKSQQ
ncbi:nucleotidyl transferase AbiEii/AbiGii toxin family protein [Amycolatopsis sp. NPDC003676]